MGKILFILFLLSVACFGDVPPKIFLVVIDGVRDLEIKGGAMDDAGNPVSVESIFPNLTRLKKEGAFFPSMEISNSVGVSLPGYADIITGSRQKSIINNDATQKEIDAVGPTIFDEAKAQLKWGTTDIMVLTSWGAICPIASKAKGESAFYKSCGWAKGKYAKPEVYEGSRADSDTFVEASKLISEKHPKLTFIHFGDADEEAHLVNETKKKAGVFYGIHGYHEALQASDYYIGRLWEQLQADPFYKGSTYLFVTTDHGRDDAGKTSWSDHGSCGLCSGYRHVFGLALGPSVKIGTFETKYQHVDIAPTIARLLGIELPSASGKPIPEIVGKRGLASKG